MSAGIKMNETSGKDDLEEMGLTKILLVTMLASGFAVASFGVLSNVKQQEFGREPNQCGFCYYYFQTERSPYEVLWKLGAEIRQHTSPKQQALMLMDTARLKVAEYIFNDYCHKLCGEKDNRFEEESGVVAPCQRENGVVNHEF